MFPVVWDVRSAANLLSIWQDIYLPESPSPMENILKEAAESGFNAIIVRSELGDTWFPPEPGTYGDSFFPLAASVRELGLHLIPGGIYTDIAEDQHNQSVIDYLKIYIQMTADKYPGDVIAFFGFDEPDVKYLENSGLETEWVEMISYWSEVSRSELGLDVVAYFAKYSEVDSAGEVVYYSDTTCVLNRLARYIDVVGMDMYPAKNNFRRTDQLSTEADSAIFTCATDLIQTDNLYIQAQACRDEIIQVFPSGDSAVVRISEIVWDGIDLHLETGSEIPLSFLPDGFASSDFRAGYAAREGEGYVNSGVVLWREDQLVEQAVLIFSRDGQPTVISIPRTFGFEDLRPVFFSVGQTDYWADVTYAEGIIGRGRLAVLACLEDLHGELWLMLYAASGSSLHPVFSSPRKLYFPASGAVWGTFWGTWYEFGTIQPVARNGFVIYDEQGRYISLHQLGLDYWQLFPAYGASQFTNLLGSQEMPDFLRVTRLDGDYPPFFAGRDLLTGYYSESQLMVTAMSLFSGGPLTELDSITVTGLPGEVTGFDLLRNDHRYSDRPLFTVAGGDVYSGIGSMETGESSGTVQVETVKYCSGDTVIAGVRAMYTRDAIRSALVSSQEGFYIPYSELYADIVDHERFQWYPNAHRTGMEMGIRTTERDNCLFAVIQSYGRHGFALPSYCASRDTLLYMVTCPVVEGARGLVFYALDIAMMCGNGGDDGISRAPWLLQNWGPSRDMENRDMIGDIHSTVSSLTGSGSGTTDYLGTLVDTTWQILSEASVFNLDPADSLLNFIALQSSGSDSVILLAVNQGTSVSPFSSGIVFENLPVGFEITDSHGWQPAGPLQRIDLAGNTVTMLDYSGIPPLSASVLTLTDINQEACQGTWLETGTSSAGTTSLTFSLCNQENGRLFIYDITGRRVSQVWEGIGLGTPLTTVIERGRYPSGMYFAVLETEFRIVTGKCVLW